jgi:hypothetical protein
MTHIYDNELNATLALINTSIIKLKEDLVNGIDTALFNLNNLKWLQVSMWRDETYSTSEQMLINTSAIQSISPSIEGAIIRVVEGNKVVAIRVIESYSILYNRLIGLD